MQGNSTTAATDLELVPSPNLPKNEDSRQPQCPEDKESAIVEAFLSGKVQAVAHTLEMGKYNEYSPMLDIVCAGKDVEGTYKVVKHLLDNVGTMYDFRKSGLYKHMKFRDIDEAILDGVKEKLLEGFRNEEEFGYMAGYEPWEKLIFDR